MMKRKILLLMIIAAGVVFTSCGRVIRPSDNMVSHSLNLADFDEIDASVVNVRYSVGTPGMATLTAPDNVIDLIEVRVKNGELKVGLKENISINGRYDATLTVSSTSLREVDCAAAATVTVGTPLVLKSDFDASVSSGAKLYIGSISCNAIKAEVSSAGEVVMDTCIGSKFKSELSSAGTIKIAKLTVAGEVSIETSSAAKVDIDTAQSRRLTAEASSSSSVLVTRGDVGTVKLEASSGASIKVGATFDSGTAEASSGASIHTHTDKLGAKETSSGASIHSL